MLARRLLFIVLILLVFILLGLVAQRVPSFEWVVEHEQHLREQVSSSPWSSWGVGTTLYVILSLVPAMAGKSVIAGWLFGFWPAVAMIEDGLTTAAVITFLLTRFVWRDMIPQRYRARIGVLSRRVESEGAFYLLLVRFAHVPYSLVNYAAGVTSIPLFTFCWTTVIGLLPRVTVLAFIGSRLPSLQVVAEKGVLSFIDLPLFLALALSALLPFFVRPLLRRFAKRSHAAGTITQKGDVCLK